MNIIYMGGYKKRYTPVIEQLKDLQANSSVLELCFGDIHIAKFCKNAGYRWLGLDLNEHFVQHARASGFDAQRYDVTSDKPLPAADVCIMMGSLYHFHPNPSIIVSKMLQAAKVVVISEPVVNLSHMKGPLGFLAKRSADAGKGNETFRYTSSTFQDMLRGNALALGYDIAHVQPNGKDLVVKLIKNKK